MVRYHQLTFINSIIIIIMLVFYALSGGLSVACSGAKFELLFLLSLLTVALVRNDPSVPWPYDAYNTKLTG